MRPKFTNPSFPILRRCWWPALLTAMCSFAIASRSAEGSPEQTGPDFESFEIITERNIFDPNRRPRERETRPVERPKPPKVDRLELVGTLISDTNALAFFVGTESGYRGAFKKGAIIAGHKLLAVAPDSVRLEMDDKSVELKVGQQMSRREGEAWKLASESAAIERNVPVAESRSVMARENSAGDNSKADTGGDSTNEILKRLMERRKQELQQ